MSHLKEEYPQPTRPVVVRDNTGLLFVTLLLLLTTLILLIVTLVRVTSLEKQLKRQLFARKRAITGGGPTYFYV